jgi:hypothetical protein
MLLKKGALTNKNLVKSSGVCWVHPVLLSGATQGIPRADSNEETGMNEPKHLLYTERFGVQIRGSSDELQKKQMWRQVGNWLSITG